MTRHSGRSFLRRSSGRFAGQGIENEVLFLPCGHYSLELAPFSYAAALRMGLFLFRNLA